MTVYRTNSNLEELKQSLDQIFATRYNLRYIIKGLDPYIKDFHKEEFQRYCESMQ